MKQKVAVTVNGRRHEHEVEPRLLLVHHLRDNLGLTGTHIGCDTSQCGACTILMNGQAVKACNVFAVQADGATITTIEGLAQNGALHKVQKAWIEHDVPQCGYCQTGMIMAVAALLKEKPKPTDADINQAITNICRCGTFQQVREAIHAAANA
jgi:isoquinoline 1-oxidoreductase alpha subunit